MLLLLLPLLHATTHGVVAHPVVVVVVLVMVVVLIVVVVLVVLAVDIVLQERISLSNQHL